jgi:hypothetical protein
MTNHRHLVLCFSAALCAFASLRSAIADSFRSAYYDRTTNQLVLAMAYRGTNPGHKFTLQWGPCRSDGSEGMSKVDADVLDDQFKDAAQQDYQTVERFSLVGMPCPRPVTVTLYTAPRMSLMLVVPR